MELCYYCGCDQDWSYIKSTGRGLQDSTNKETDTKITATIDLWNNSIKTCETYFSYWHNTTSKNVLILFGQLYLLKCWNLLTIQYHSFFCISLYYKKLLRKKRFTSNANQLRARFSHKIDFFDRNFSHKH